MQPSSWPRTSREKCAEVVSRNSTVEPLCKEVLGTMNDTLCPSNSEMYEKEPR